MLYKTITVFNPSKSLNKIFIKTKPSFVDISITIKLVLSFMSKLFNNPLFRFLFH